MTHVVVVGAGHGGIAAVEALRAAGSTARITVIGAESELPYERPPLSKDVLLGKVPLESVRLRLADWYTDHDIDLRLGTRVERIDRETRTVFLDDGSDVHYDHLILATGGSPRVLPGTDLAGVTTLLTPDDSFALQARLASSRHPVIIGAGFIGLEVAAAAAAGGHRPVVVEMADRVLARVAAPPVSAAVAAHHRAAQVDLRLETGIAGFASDGGVVTGVRTSAGELLPADLVIVGVGSTANDQLAASAGLECANGVVVDSSLRTSNLAISAIGDCARFPFRGQTVRLESVQNAVDQAKHVAARILGTVPDDAPYDAVPWFWSTQGTVKLQMVGIGGPDDTSVIRGDPATGKFSVFRFDGPQLICVESINHPAGHLAGRRILATGVHPTPAQVADPAFDLKALLSAVPSS